MFNGSLSQQVQGCGFRLPMSLGILSERQPEVFGCPSGDGTVDFVGLIAARAAVVLRQLVAAFAPTVISPASVPGPIAPQNVFHIGHQLQVGWVHASPVSAKVIGDEGSRDGLAQYGRQDDPMGVGLLAVEPDASVAVRVRQQIEMVASLRFGYLPAGA